MAGGPLSGARSAEWYRAAYYDASVSGVILAAGAGLAGVIAAKSAKFTVFVQKLTITITTSAAQTITVRDSAGTPIVLFVVPASAAVGTVYVVDFGARGFALTAGKNLDIAGTAGPAYAYAIDAYQQQTVADQASTVDRTF